MAPPAGAVRRGCGDPGAGPRRGYRRGDPFGAGADRGDTARVRGGPGLAAGEPGCAPRGRGGARRRVAGGAGPQSRRGGRPQSWHRARPRAGHRRAGQRRGIRLARHAGAAGRRRWTRNRISPPSAAASWRSPRATTTCRPGAMRAACCRTPGRHSMRPPSSAPATRSAAPPGTMPAATTRRCSSAGRNSTFAPARAPAAGACAIAATSSIRHKVSAEQRVAWSGVPLVLFRAQPAVCRAQARRELGGAAAAAGVYLVRALRDGALRQAVRAVGGGHKPLPRERERSRCAAPRVRVIGSARSR